MKLAASLQRLKEHFGERGTVFAVVGGLAASALAEARFTRDVDIALAVADDAEAEGVIFGLVSHGYRVVATVEQEATNRLATARLRDPIGVACDLVFATCGIEAEVVGSARTLEVFPGQEVPVASVEAVLAMKVLSATGERPRDLGDIQALVRMNPSFDEGALLVLLETIEARGYARGQALRKKWARLRAELRV